MIFIGNRLFYEVYFMKKLQRYPAFFVMLAIVATACPARSGNLEDGASIPSIAAADRSDVAGAPIWAEEFDGPLDLTTQTHVGRWRPVDHWQDLNVGYKDFAGDSWNVNPNQHPLHSPFAIADGLLTLTAKKTPPAIVPDIEAVVGTGKAPIWSGGMLISERLQRTFKYGYFEIRARWPNPGKGLLVRQLQRIHPHEATLLLVGLAQRHQPIVLEDGHEVLLLAQDRFKVISHHLSVSRNQTEQRMQTSVARPSWLRFQG